MLRQMYSTRPLRSRTFSAASSPRRAPHPPPAGPVARSALPRTTAAPMVRRGPRRRAWPFEGTVDRLDARVEHVRHLVGARAEYVAQDEHGALARRQDLQGDHEGQGDGFGLLVACRRAHGTSRAPSRRVSGYGSSHTASPGPGGPGGSTPRIFHPFAPPPLG